MSLSQLETQALSSIADGLAGSDARLASMLTIFSRLAAGEQMPAREKTRVRRGRPATVRAAPGGTRAGTQPARNRAACTRGWAGSRPCWCWGVIFTALLTAALALTASGHATCPVDGNGVPLALRLAAGRRGQALMRCARK